ncbi:MAG: dynamin family protein [Bryobacterales bacterium]|nr:dynamin family protein [Bryobacterales bacterium]
MKPASGLNSSHELHLLVSCKHADKLLSEIEEILRSASSKSPFPKYRIDFSPAQGRTVEDHLARIRAQMVRVLRSLGITPEEPQLGAIHSIRVTLAFVRIAIQEMRPKVLAGYGELPREMLAELNGLMPELEGLVERLDSYLARGEDLQARLSRFEAQTDDAAEVKRLGETIQSRGLVELRPAIEAILDRLEDQRLEIAIFGQVSCGKSSLLNHILGADILPVGTTPITAVPTRLQHGTEPKLLVAFAGYKVESFPTSRLAEFVTEQENPSNTKGVWKVQVEYPAARLRQGVVFVDTPGLGSMATSGSRETLAYLPRCDIGVVMVNSSSTLTLEDVRTLQLLLDSGVTVRVVLSKADLLSKTDLEKSLRYVRERLQSELRLDVGVTAVSTVGEHEVLLRQWFDEEIAPLQERQKQLAAESLHGKIAALGRAVERALEAARQWSGQLEPERLERLREAERRLRQAAGEIPTVEAACLKRCDEIRQLGPAALRYAARGAVEYWRRENSSRLPDGFPRKWLVKTAASVAREITQALEGLAGALTQALREVSGEMEIEREPGEDLAGLLRGMPQIDLAFESTGIRRPFVARFGRRLAESSVERQLREAYGARVNEAFVSHGRLLEAWLRRTLYAVQQRFDLHADAYRAQLGRILEMKPVSRG